MRAFAEKKNRDACANNFCEIAPVNFKMVHGRGVQFVAFRFKHELLCAASGARFLFIGHRRWPSAHHSRGIANRGHNPRISSASANIALHVLDNFRVGRIGIRFQKRHCAHDHSRRAVSALHRAFIEERLLHGMQLAVAFQAFDRRDRFFADRADISDARVARISVNEHGARAALTFAAAVFAAGQVKLIAKHAEQGSVRRGVNFVGFAVDLKFSDSA